jgi:hypothetical protein
MRKRKNLAYYILLPLSSTTAQSSTFSSPQWLKTMTSFSTGEWDFSQENEEQSTQILKKKTKNKKTHQIEANHCFLYKTPAQWLYGERFNNGVL